MFGIDDIANVAGIGIGIAGALGAANAAKKKSGAERAIAGFEMQADQQRRQAMELNASRQSLQTLRNAQQARSISLAAATNQGAQFGSGLAGGQATVSGQAGNSLLGISQNLEIGRNLFNINQNIDAAKMTVADAETQMATDQALMSVGSSLGKGVGAFKNITGFNPQFNSLFSTG